METRRGSGLFRTRPNPVPLAEAVAAAERLDLGTHRFASLTGGEPLLQPAAALALARALRERGPRIFLETHGLAAAALEQVIGAVDVVSMDWKLASDVRRASDPRGGPVRDFDETHTRFLCIAREAPEVVVKMVVTPASEDEEIDRACARIAEEAPDATVVLQPVTPFGPVREGPGPERLLGLLARVSKTLPGVRLIPQTHKTAGFP